MTTYEKVKEWRLKNPDKVAEQNKRYAKKHPETHKKAALKYRAKNLEEIREKEKLAARTKRKNDPIAQKKRNEHYKIRREAKRWEEAGRPRAEWCEICGTKEYTVFDHCHKTEKFRGWICDRCNKILGLVKDDPNWLRKLADYLEVFNDSSNNKETQCSA